MYKVILVDDEDLIIKGLKTFVNWDSLGFAVVGQASNGSVALDMVRKLKPHVVLADIKMPCCTGIELMMKIKEEGLTAKTVI